jgi:glucose/arabinose dehydrogenase
MTKLMKAIKMKWLRFLPITVLMGFTGVSSAGSLTTEVVASGLQNPWSLAFINDEQMLVTERPGRLRLVSTAGEVSEPISGLPPIQVGRQGGLLDVIVDRDFKANRRLYFCYTAPENDDLTRARNSTALASAMLSADNRSLSDVQILFRQNPLYAGGLHFGCRLVQRPDGTLMMGLGDRYNLMNQAQSLDQHLGKVIRIDADGSIPADNPFVGQAGAEPAIWSYGHRNIQGAILSADGQLWMHEHGPQGGDELNLIEAGVNYGWPVITYGVQYGGGVIGQGITEAPGMAQPVTYWAPSIAPSGMAQITTDRYGPDWQGNFVLGSLKFRYLVRLVMNGNEVVSESLLLPDLGQRVRDVRQGPDGLLYVLTDRTDGQVLRLMPAAGLN